MEIIAESDNRFHVIGEKTPVIHARPGERLRLRITAHKGQEIARDGAVHSLVVRKLREQGWDLRLYEGTQEFTVNAPASSGEFLAECTVKCGPGHDDMRLQWRQNILDLFANGLARHPMRVRVRVLGRRRTG